MSTWKGIVGTGFTAADFDSYCHALHWTQWRPTFITLHNTGSPTLDQRPSGFNAKHMDNFVHYYRDTKGWSAGPHLFVDDHLIWVFTPLTVSGVHSPSFNKQAIGIEMLGDYNKDIFDSGRGAAVRDNAVAAIATLSAVLGLPPASLKLHHEDPKTTHTDCPGKHVSKDDMIARVTKLMEERHPGEHLVA